MDFDKHFIAFLTKSADSVTQSIEVDLKNV